MSIPIRLGYSSGGRGSAGSTRTGKQSVVELVVCLSAPRISAPQPTCTYRQRLFCLFSTFFVGGHDPSSILPFATESHLSFTNFPLLPPAKMIRFLVLFSLLIVGICHAETLSTGEDVTEFVRSKIDDHDVSLVVRSSSNARRSACTN